MIQMNRQESKTEENRPLRNHEQSMGIWTIEPMLRDPEIRAEGDISRHYFQTPVPTPTASEKSYRPPRPGKRNAAQTAEMVGV